jgi:hypothetical protein
MQGFLEFMWAFSPLSYVLGAGLLMVMLLALALVFVKVCLR